MTSSLSRIRTSSFARRTLQGGAILCLALGVGLSGCGGRVSTNTGNPPMLMEDRLNVAATTTGVRVSGGAGAVTAGSSVTVTHVSGGETESTTVSSNGSFSVELPGAPSDEYRVEAELDGETTEVSLNEPGSGGVSLVGRDFLLETSEGFTPVEDSVVRISFTETDFSFHAGCNGHSGTYSLCDGKLCVGGFGSTDIGCGEARQAQDEWFADFFTASPSLATTADRVTFTGPDATLTFLDEERANPDRPLVGTTWYIDTYISAGSASSSSLTAYPSVTFDEDGTLRVTGPCNTGGGTYVVDGTSIELTGIAYTEEGCTEANDQEAESHIQSVLTDGTIEHTIDATRLNLTRGDQGLSATSEGPSFEPSP